MLMAEWAEEGERSVAKRRATLRQCGRDRF
jgi:hypothetical protein